MQRQRLIKGVISGALVGGLVLGSVGLVSASSNSSSTDQAVSNQKIECKFPGDRGFGKGMGINLDLASLVKAGIITSDESSAIQKKIDELNSARQAEMEKIKAMTETERQAYFKDNKPERTDLLTTLTNDGIISSAKAEAIQTFIEEQRQQEMQTKLNDSLSSLVEKGTINQAQADKILAKLSAENTARKAEMEKVKAMTETEREAYFKQNPKEKTGPLADLVSAGTITQAQADAVMSAMPGPGHHGPGDGRGGGRGPGNHKMNQNNTNTNN